MNDVVAAEGTYRRDSGASLGVIVPEQRHVQVTRDHQHRVDDVLVADDDHRRHVMTLHRRADVADRRSHAARRRQRHARRPQRRPVLRRGRRHGILERRSPVGKVGGGQNGDEMNWPGGDGGDGAGGID